MLPFIISNIRTIHGRYYIMTKIKETSYFNNVSIKKISFRIIYMYVASFIDRYTIDISAPYLNRLKLPTHRVTIMVYITTHTN